MRRTNVFTTQWMHDYIVRQVSASAKGYLVHTNVHDSMHEGHGSHVGVGREVFAEVFPDLLLCDPESFSVRHIIEVQTDESPPPQHIARWVQMSRSMRGLPESDFWILVPPSRLAEIRNLSRRLFVPVNIGTWELGPRGLTITWDPAHEAAVPTPASPPMTRP